MRLYLIPSLIAYTLTGCKDSGANTGDVGVDFIIDVSNEKFADKPTEEQKKKYSVLAGKDCTTKMSASIEKLITDESMKKQLPAKAQTTFEEMKKQEPEVRKVTVGATAKVFCDLAALLK